MNESNAKIFYTSDYGMFHFVHGNRDLNEAKIEKIIKSVNGGLNFFRYCPIMVNEDYFIIDGQHRFIVCKKLKLPVFYIVVPKFSLRQIAEINNNQSKWKTRDFLNCYIDAGINKEDYLKLEEITHKYHVMISTAINLLQYGKVGSGGMSEDFRDGKFKVNYLDLTISILERSKDYEKFGAEWKSRNFLQAIEKLLLSDKYNHLSVLKKLEKCSLVIEHQTSCKEYLHHIEELFNYKNSNRQILY